MAKHRMSKNDDHSSYKHLKNAKTSQKTSEVNFIDQSEIQPVPQPKDFDEIEY